MSDGPSAGGRSGERVFVTVSPIEHSDDEAVLRFAEAMRDKLKRKRKQGRGGWDNPAECPIETLERMLAEHVAKGDPVDIANFAMMIWNRKKDQS